MDFYSSGTIDINATKEFTIRHYMHFPTITAAYHMNLNDPKRNATAFVSAHILFSHFRTVSADSLTVFAIINQTCCT